jgi:hypothetical protein
MGYMTTGQAAAQITVDTLAISPLPANDIAQLLAEQKDLSQFEVRHSSTSHILTQHVSQSGWRI